MDKILLTICARGGSKGVKDKNILPFLGKPLIVHTINQAKLWERAKYIVVSTDSARIAEIAKDAGAQVPFMRPAELANDTAPKGKVIQHALLECERIFGERFDMVTDLDVTAPLRTVEDIEKCYQEFIKHQPKTLFTVVEANKNPYFNLVEQDTEGRAVLCKTGGSVFRRQDAPKVYAMNASIYFYQRDYLLNEEAPFAITDNSRMVCMDQASGLDIDHELDYKYLEFLQHEGTLKL